MLIDKSKIVQRYNNIELFRFIFAVLIVVFHFSWGGQYEINRILPGLNRCSVCVDFFFIMSGFFLFNKTNLVQSVSDFAIKRFLRLAPLLWMFLIIQFVFSLFIKNIHFNFGQNILRILLLHNIGFAPITGGIGAHQHWFISVIFWVSLFYFYLAKVVDKKYLNLIIWIMVICSLGLYLNHKQFGVGGHAEILFNFINIGILRGIFGIGIGYFISNLYNSGFLQKHSRNFFILITVLECYLIGFLINYLIFTDKLPGKSSVLYLISFSTLFYLFLVKQGLISNALNKNFSAKLGTFSYAIYVIHPIVPHVLNNIIYSNYLRVQHKTIYFFLLVFVAVAAGALLHYLFEKPVSAKIKKYLQDRL